MPGVPGVHPDDRIAEDALEVLAHRVGDQDVPVGEVEDAIVALVAGTLHAAPVVPELPDQLQRRERLARAGRHDQENAPVPSGGGEEHLVDGPPLVVPQLLDAAVRVQVLPVERGPQVLLRQLPQPA